MPPVTVTGTVYSFSNTPVTLSTLNSTAYSSAIYLYWTIDSTLSSITYYIYLGSTTDSSNLISTTTTLFWAITGLNSSTSYTFTVLPYYNGSAKTSSTITVTTTASSFYTPMSYYNILQSTYSDDALSSPVTSITNKNRYLIQVGSNTNTYLGIQSTTSSTIFTATLNTINSITDVSNVTVLSSAFQLVQNTFDLSNNYSYYRIDSDLHSNFSLDCSWNSINKYSPNLQFLNNWGIDRSTDTSFNETDISFNAGGITYTSGTGGNPGYIVFQYNSTNNTLIAKERYYYDDNYYINTGTTSNPTGYTVYNAGGGGEGHILDSGFPYAGYYLYYDGSSLTLDASNNSNITLYDSPIDLSVPSQFNPLGIGNPTNLATSLYSAGTVKNGLKILYSTNTSVASKLTNNAKSSPAGYNYTNQMYTYSSTDMSITNKSTADSYVYNMLDTIFSTDASSITLRYTKEFYKTLREGLLQNVTTSHSLSNAYLTGKTVLQVYFTNEQDTSGNYCPFMVILNTSSPSGPCRFLDVHKPPGDAINHYSTTQGSSNTYSYQYVTRNAAYQSFLTKIPMRDYGYSGDIDSSSGNLNNSVMDQLELSSGAVYTSNSTTYDYFNYSSSSSCGIAIDSTQIYPVLNSSSTPSCGAAELTAQGNHSGVGLGLHYHADPFQCGTNNMNFYNKNDYVGQTHPPLIGMAFDGIAIYGSYIIGYDVSLNNGVTTTSYEYAYSSMDGYDISLDSYGAHTHGNYGYHYHANPVSSQSIPCYASQTSSKTYPVYALLYGSWAGLVTSIPYFTDLDKPSQQNIYVGFAKNIS